jgi:hypothetical protein
VSINGAEGNFRAFKEALEGETMIPEYDTLVTAADMPGLVRWLARKVIDERRAHLLSCTRKWRASLASCEAFWFDISQRTHLDTCLSHPCPQALVVCPCGRFGNRRQN